LKLNIFKKGGCHNQPLFLDKLPVPQGKVSPLPSSLGWKWENFLLNSHSIMRKPYSFLSCLISLLIILLVSGCHDNIRLVTGCFTETVAEGISVYDFNPGEGTLKLVSKGLAGPDPSYFCFSEGRKLIYAINEVNQFNGKTGGGLTALSFDDKNGKIEKINDILIPNGGPCYISISPDGEFLLVASYGSGSVAVIRLDKKGIPAEVTDTIVYVAGDGKKSHPHMISFDPSGRKVYMTDLGLDRIMIYDLDKISGQLKPSVKEAAYLPEGSGPRHFVFSSNGSKMYVINELNSTIVVFNVVENGGLVLAQSLATVKKGFEEKNYCADIHIGKNEEFLYGSNRGENSIVTFRIEKDGLLNLAGHTSCEGDWPRNFVIDPAGKYILVGNQKSGNIAILKIDAKTGVPSKLTQKIDLASPACLKF
jgi:6-phosphogluconolactonase